MKKIFLLIFINAIFVCANAKIIIISVDTTFFSPNNISDVSCEDTVTWSYLKGNHSIVSTTIPATGTPWNFLINNSGNQWAHTIYPKVEGMYRYKAAAPDTFTGFFVVTCGLSIRNFAFNFNSVAYPNPCSNKISIDATGADMVSLYSIAGERIKCAPLKNGQTKIDFDLDGLTCGIYFYRIIKEGIIVETKRIIKN